MTHVLKDIGHAGNQGWRERIADQVAPRLASRTSVQEDQVRAAVGLLFLSLSVLYFVQTIKSLRAQR